MRNANKANKSKSNHLRAGTQPDSRERQKNRSRRRSRNTKHKSQVQHAEKTTESVQKKVNTSTEEEEIRALHTHESNVSTTLPLPQNLTSPEKKNLATKQFNTATLSGRVNVSLLNPKCNFNLNYNIKTHYYLLRLLKKKQNGDMRFHTATTPPPTDQHSGNNPDRPNAFSNVSKSKTEYIKTI